MKTGTGSSKWVVCFSVIVLLCGLSPTVFAVPQLISYQGRLTDSDGKPLTKTVDVTFTFWNAEAGGSQLGSFSDTDSVTPSGDGLFSTLIGDDPDLLIPSDLFLADSVWLNINVNGTNLRPRTRMVSTGYAFEARRADMSTTSLIALYAVRSGNADTVDKKHAEDFSAAEHTHGFRDITGVVSDAQLPAGITRDSELTDGLATKANAAHTHDKSDLLKTGTLGFDWLDGDVADGLTINGGTLDNTPIGASTPSTGAFTSLSNTGATTLGQNSGSLATINSALKITSGSPGDNKLLVSDASGNATWQANVNADTLDSYHASAFQQKYQNIKVVAKSGGDYSTISAALNAITDASNSNRYLVYVAPGVYNERVTMKSYVDIEGAGEMTTKITQPGSNNSMIHTLTSAGNCEVRFLTVENTGGNLYAYAVTNIGENTQFTHVTILASGGTSACVGFRNTALATVLRNVTISLTGSSDTMFCINAVNPSNLKILNSSVSATGATNCLGIYNSGDCDLLLRDSTLAINAKDNESGYSYGIQNYGTTTMTNTDIEARYGQLSRGIYNGGMLTIQTSTIDALSGGIAAYGIYNLNSVFIRNSDISAVSGVSNYGIFNTATSGAYNVQIDGCKVIGNTSAVYGDAEFTIRVGTSKLAGGAVAPNGASCTCAGVYDEAYVFYASTCP